ncbi:preprotein translocase subunit SecA [Candidatus Atribacteria bacterium RBG_19FT_COMBO_35_14]|uniref:Protein translocase subunit SecA n=1 Tax=Candidatus Sediminicultor quintus TaxID=1797291 RepID=A0A1F5AA87_9BACT|nr:MAG: preprotein translocase subunit SecA [Candidatus Atribacteria bacterium RBG_19FT_COMBO_35_14]
MFDWTKKIFGDPVEKELKRLQPIIEKINSFEPDILKLNDEELKNKTPEFRERLDKGETLDDILPEVFAVVREAAKRVTKMRPFDVQLVGGIVLHQGKIAEMATGEGKTLVATMPAYLNALNGESVHIVTVNDYLAKRDRYWMGGIYEFLGLKAGLIQHDMRIDERKEAYEADITYGTNNEFGFDYLRDNMAVRLEDVVQKGYHFAIVDEVDSILIDEARTPLIISGPSEESTKMYQQANKVATRLQKEEDYKVYEKEKTITITEEGVSRIEGLLQINNLYDEKNINVQHHIIQALKAQRLFKRDVDYIVKDGEVIIVDEFTGRLMFGRRYSDGLHQAIEAKEGVVIAGENQTLATITFQNYFRLYKKLSGMTGTAKTEEEEFIHIYNLPVAVIPPNRRLIRYGYTDVIYRTEREKFKAVIQEIVEVHKIGRPILVGTVSIDKSETLSRLLKKENIGHNVLNAKNHEREAEIIAQAGQGRNVTISTNMAGRGTDIVLGEGIAKLGGLHVVGTERHESRRIDNQLRGRSGRQGDPGSSRFFLSLEDTLMRLFGSDRISGIMEKLGMEEDVPIEHPLVTKSIESAQKKVEGRNFEIRKQLLDFDNEMEYQRKVIYEQRRMVLESKDVKEYILEMVKDTIENILQSYTNKEIYPEEWDWPGLKDHINQIFAISFSISKEEIPKLSITKLKDILTEKTFDIYELREKEFTPPLMRQIETMIVLRVVDREWKDNLRRLDELKQGIGLRAYGQKDPLMEYHFEANNMFQDMINSIKEEVVKFIYKVRLKKEESQRVSQTRRETPAPMVSSQTKKSPFIKREGLEEEEGQKKKKIGRNDPCPCGSGLKYKHCCGKNV